MLSLASVHLRNLYDSALDYLSQKNWQESSPGKDCAVPSDTPSILPLQQYALLRDRLDAARLSSTGSLAAQAPVYMRREIDFTKTELARTKSDVALLEERCKILEKTLKDTRNMLRAREVEVEKVRKERDRERLSLERRKSDAGPLHQPPQPAQDGNGVHPGRSSLDMRTNSGPAPSTHPTTHLNGRSLPLAVGKSSASQIAPGSRATVTQNGSKPNHNYHHHHRHHFNNSPIPEEERARQRSSEAYLTRTDSLSGAQVLQALHDINSEIFQFAASATEVCSFNDSTEPPPSSSRTILSSSRSAQAMHDTSSRLGPNIARILSSRDHSQDPLLVQLALQGCITICIARALSAFCLGFPAESDNILSQIYTRMALAEPQPTSSKWRALTHRNIHALYPNLDDSATNKLAESMIRWAADVFLISGCASFHDLASHSPSSSPSKLSFLSSSPSFRSLNNQPSFASFASSSHTTTHAALNHNSHAAASHPTTTTTATAHGLMHIRDSLRTHFGDQIRRLARSTTQLATTLREEILSTSFEVVAVDHTQAFDSSVMCDMFREYTMPHTATNSVNKNVNGANIAGPAVLVTTELGLRCTTRMGNQERVGLDEDVTIERRVLLKPKVVLESVMDVLDR
ncbi:hypothetical protein AX17_006602 [Amanita inopinata Kibby_2008]|nr:hypothetical protein AX17_006602 [Amanita inopinata Kibby_2008]